MKKSTDLPRDGGHLVESTVRAQTVLPTYFLGCWTSQVAVLKNLPPNAGDVILIPGSGRFPGEGNGNILQYSCLGSSMNRGANWTTVHSIAKSETRH